MARGRPGDDQPVFPMRDGRGWTDSAYRNWRRKIFTPAAKSVGIEKPRPYDLRHSYASLLFAEGMNPAEIAEQLGHSIQTLLKTYTHVMEELRGQPRGPGEELIRDARGQHGPQKAPEASMAANPSERPDRKFSPQQELSSEPTRGLEPRTPSLRVMCSTS
jgi:hypothetical protein